MQLLTWMQPRDLKAGARVVSVLSAIGVGVTVVFLPFNGQGDQDPHLVLVVLGALSLAAVAGLSVAAWFFDEASRLAWALCPLLTIAAIVVIDVATYDASVTAQIFFLFPTLYGASLLPRPGAILVTGASILGEALVVFTHLSFHDAIIDAGYVAAALTATSAMLIRGGESQVILMAELQRRATIDPLTGLVTRRVFEEAAESALSRSTQDDDGTSLILLDVDWFKSVNDRYGHLGGDEVLVQLADLLVGGSRRGDVVCRMGGDEVAVLLPGCPVSVASRRALQLIEEVNAHGFSLSVGSIINVSVSVGLAHAPTHASSARALYEAADAALYEAKRAGRNRLVAQTRLA